MSHQPFPGLRYLGSRSLGGTQTILSTLHLYQVAHSEHLPPTKNMRGNSKQSPARLSICRPTAIRFISSAWPRYPQVRRETSTDEL